MNDFHLSDDDDDDNSSCSSQQTEIIQLSSDDDVVELESNDQDKTDKCPICLVSEIGNSNRAYASTCFHKFCFDCLLEWSRVRPSCPVCKRAFDRIVYNCKSSRDFAEYHVNNKTPYDDEEEEDQPDVQIIGYLSPSKGKLVKTVPRESWVVGKQCSPVHFRVLVYANEWRVEPALSQQIVNERIVHYTSQAVLVDDDPARHLYTSSRWFCANESRLVSWLERELDALASLYPEVASSAARLGSKVVLVPLLEHLARQNVTGVAELLRCTSRVAAHFLHELGSFAASSSQGLVEYDARAVYFATQRRGRRFLTSAMLPVNLSKYRLLPDDDDDENSNVVVDMAHHFVEVGSDTNDYVKRILLTPVSKRSLSSDDEDSSMIFTMSEDEEDKVVSTPSQPDTFFLISSDEDEEVVARVEPATPPPRRRKNRVRRRITAQHHLLQSHKAKRIF